MSATYRAVDTVGEGDRVRTAEYGVYTDRLRLLAADVARGSWGRVEQDVHHALNGQAAQQLRSLVPLQVRRDEGAFFTGGPVRAKFASLLGGPEASVTADRYWDPSCGAGDLLIAASERLPTAPTLAGTVRLWGGRLRGCDLHHPFVDAARLRLFLAAAARHQGEVQPQTIDLESGLRAFRKVEVGDGLAELRTTAGYSGHLLLNPPYGNVFADDDCDWSSGAVSQAAVFVLAGAQALKVGQQLHAVLPDVLRSGSRYEPWRSRIESVLKVDRAELYGQFDTHTDIDVFFLGGTRKRKSRPVATVAPWWPAPIGASTIEEAFEVRVGPVVDNRDPHAGPSAPFLTARDLPTTGTRGVPGRTRQFAGRLVAPPFVAIRRTSRPGARAGGEARAAGVLVTGVEPIAVDNHLITASPLSGDESDCKRLLEVLESSAVSDWLDQRIRCRHLTVGVIRSLPWSH